MRKIKIVHKKRKKKPLKYFTCHNDIRKLWSFRAHDDLINLIHVFTPFNINNRLNENALTVYLESNPWSLTSTSTSDRVTCLYDTAVVAWPISVLLNKLQVLNTVFTSSPEHLFVSIYFDVYVVLCIRLYMICRVNITYV